VFAGQDVEATARARSYFDGFPPSSPQIAIMEGGRLVHLLQRHEIEGRTADQVAAALTAAYDKLGAGGGNRDAAANREPGAGNRQARGIV